MSVALPDARRDAVSRALQATFGATDEQDGDGEVIDLMEALKRSVEANRAKAKPPSGPSTRKRA